MKNMSELKKGTLGFCENVFKNFGLDTLSSRIIGLLYINKEPVAMETLAKETGYSLASISNKMKLITGIGIVQKIKKPGSKKVYFYMEKDLFKMMEAKIEKAYQAEVLPAKTELPGVIEKYSKKKLSKEDQDILDIIKNYYEQILVIEKGMHKLTGFLRKMENKR